MVATVGEERLTIKGKHHGISGWQNSAVWYYSEFMTLGIGKTHTTMHKFMLLKPLEVLRIWA